MRDHLIENASTVSSLLVVLAVAGVSLIHRGNVRQRRFRPARARRQSELARDLWLALAVAELAERATGRSHIDLTAEVDLRASPVDLTADERADRLGSSVEPEG